LKVSVYKKGDVTYRKIEKSRRSKTNHFA